MSPRRIELTIPWIYSILLWLVTHYVILDLYERGIVNVRQLLFFPVLYIFPNVFLTIGLITERYRLFLPMIGSMILAMVIFWIHAAYEICVVLLPNAYWMLTKLDDELPYKPSLLLPVLAAFEYLVGSLFNLFIAVNLYAMMTDQREGLSNA